VCFALPGRHLTGWSSKRGQQGVQQNWKAFTRPASIGLEFCLSVLVGLFGGRWLDNKLGTSHWLTFIGLGFGIAAGYRAIYRATVAANRQAELDEEREKAERKRYHDNGKR
jgi:ATP synthase protein I